jgi:hypothetical protein
MGRGRSPRRSRARSRRFCRRLGVGSHERVGSIPRRRSGAVRILTMCAYVFIPSVCCYNLPIAAGQRGRTTPREPGRCLSDVMDVLPSAFSPFASITIGPKQPTRPESNISIATETHRTGTEHRVPYLSTCPSIHSALFQSCFIILSTSERSAVDSTKKPATIRSET